jgi:hypothetical protein
VDSFGELGDGEALRCGRQGDKHPR